MSACGELVGRRWALVTCVGVVAAGLSMVVSAPAAMADGGAVTNYTGTGISSPHGIAEGPNGFAWFTNGGDNSIGLIMTNGTVINYTDSSISDPAGIAAGPDGAMWFTNAGNNSIGRITTSGTITNYTAPSISGPAGIVTGPDGALWFVNHGSSTIGRITTGGAVSSYSGSAISEPDAITAGSDGALWFTNEGNSTIGRITTGGTVSSYSDPTINVPDAITAGSDGALWFTNLYTNTIGRITTGGTVTSYSDPSISEPEGITAGPDGALWFTNYYNNSIGRITTIGTVSNYTDPSIRYPVGIAPGFGATLWFTNSGNNSIGRITAPTTIATVCESDFKQVETATEAYKAQVGSFPGGTLPPGWTAQSGYAPIGVNAIPADLDLLGTVKGTTGKVGPWLKAYPYLAHRFQIGATQSGQVFVEKTNASATIPPISSYTPNDCTSVKDSDDPPPPPSVVQVCESDFQTVAQAVKGYKDQVGVRPGSPLPAGWTDTPGSAPNGVKASPQVLDLLGTVTNSSGDQYGGWLSSFPYVARTFQIAVTSATGKVYVENTKGTADIPAHPTYTPDDCAGA